MVRALVRLGWTVARQSGSHASMTMPGRMPVTIPIHAGTLKLGTAKAILKQASITEEELFAVY